VGECFFWYRLTRVVPDKGRKTVVIVVVDDDVRKGRTPPPFKNF